MELLDLFRPEWKHSDWRIRKHAVEHLRFPGQDLLLGIALNDNNFNVRAAALDRLALFGSNNQAALATAVALLDDQHLLWRVVVNDRNENLKVRVTALGKLADRNLLAAVAMSKINWGFHAEVSYEIRAIAAKRITDQAILAEIAKGSYPWPVRQAAAEMLTDQALAQSLLTEISRLAAESRELERRRREEEEKRLQVQQAERSRALQENCHHEYEEIKRGQCSLCQGWDITSVCRICGREQSHICT